MSKANKMKIIWGIGILMIAGLFFALFMIISAVKKDIQSTARKETCQEKYTELNIAEVLPYSFSYDRKDSFKGNDFIGFYIKLAQPICCNGKPVENIFANYNLMGAAQLVYPAHHKNHLYALKNPRFYTTDDGHDVYLFGLVIVDLIK